MPASAGEQKPLRHASAANPCPVCQNTKECTVDAGGWAVCFRTESIWAARKGGWLHRLPDPVPPPVEPAVPPTDPDAPVLVADPVTDPTGHAPATGSATPPPNFRDALRAPSDPNRLDNATGADDLSAFDRASGVTCVPAGIYVCTVVRGELLTTKTEKLAYRLTFDVNDGPHAGVRMWKYLMLDTPANANRAKAVLLPFGISTSSDLRKPFPGFGRVITVRALVVVKPRQDGTDGNDIERFDVTDDRTAQPNPNSVDPYAYVVREGGTP